jgi:hypothetical protein
MESADRIELQITDMYSRLYLINIIYNLRIHSSDVRVKVPKATYNGEKVRFTRLKMNFNMDKYFQVY